MANHVIVVNNLVKRYKKAQKNAVDKISFSVKAGEFFALLGPNGAGKTTTISILTTTLAKSSGTVTLAGFDIDTEASKVRERIGVIFQTPSLDKNLTAEENIRFHAILYGLYPFAPSFSLMPSEYKKKVTELTELLDIKNSMHKPIKTFSGGMKRKLEIVRSLIHNPKVLFLDEPTSGLDPISRKNLWNYLIEVREKEKTTIFLTTHYLEEAEEADRICVIDDGKIISLGSPQKIKNDLVEEYLLIDAKDRKKLKTELEKKSIPYHDQSPIRIDTNGHSAQEIIQKIKTPLTTLKIYSPTLEEAYVELVERNGKESHA